ncbi:HipA domain-containing protein [Campylobacter devanensis]|uniref:HipA domain-containing protein n=1 Tax=Campylobacter devanensis TaxID=3161138 RepID=UPI000A33F87B|nr:MULTISPECIES: HipA domain-containing protein [unclassified Campylobacter]
MIDFTNCKVKHTKFYDGLNGEKLAIYFNDELYMLKFPKDTHITSGYASSSINEHISSKIFESIGFNTQKTLLGYYGDKVVVACKDFETDGNRLFNFGKVRNSVLSVNSGFADTDLHNTIEIIKNQKIIDIQTLKNFFWDMFIADTLIANFDRHNGNWGILVKDDDIVTIAPIYDNGSSLYPKLSNDDIEKYLNHQGSFNDLMLNQTTSAITINSKKINPQNFLKDAQDEDVINALQRITNRINLDNIYKIIDDIHIISNERKDFYKKILNYRSNFMNEVLNKNIHSYESKNNKFEKGIF